MAGGSNAPFSGSYTDLENVPELPEGVSLNEYRTWENQIVQAVAENQFKVGLTELGYPNGFFDVFVDESKIASKSGAVVDTTNRNVQTDSSSALGINDSSEHSTSSSTFETVQTYSNIGTGLDQLEGNFFSQGFGDETAVRFKLTFEDGTEEFTSEDTTISSDSSNYAFSGWDNYKKVSKVEAQLKSEGTGVLTKVQAEEIIVEGVITSTVQNLGYSATKLTLTADYNLNGGDISAELRTGNGNTITTVSESEIGNTIDISTTATDYEIVWNLSRSSPSEPVLNNYEVGLDD